MSSTHSPLTRNPLALTLGAVGVLIAGQVVSSAVTVNALTDDSRMSGTHSPVTDQVTGNAWEAWERAVTVHGWDSLVIDGGSEVRVDFVEASPLTLIPREHTQVVTQDGVNYRFALTEVPEYSGDFGE